MAKTFFVMQNTAVDGKYRSLSKAMDRADFLQKIFPQYRHTVRTLHSPGYWKKYDAPYERYYGKKYYDAVTREIIQ